MCERVLTSDVSIYSHKKFARANFFREGARRSQAKKHIEISPESYNPNRNNTLIIC